MGLARSMSESSGGGESLWQCRHCRKELRVPPKTVFKFCPECRAPEQEIDNDTAVYCVNPNCKTKLFTPTQKLCHECATPQPKKQVHQQPKPPPRHIGQAKSTPTVPVVSFPSTSSDLASASVAALTTQAQHREVIEKAAAQTTTTQRKNSQNEDSTETFFQGSQDSSSLNESHSQPHQVSNTKSDGTHDREKQVEEGKGDMPVSKPKEATKTSIKIQEGQGHEYQLKSAFSHPLQNHSADNHSTEHKSTSNKHKQAAESGEEIADGSDPLSRHFDGADTGATEKEGASPPINDQQQKKDNIQAPNPSAYARQSSDQVCPLISIML